MSTIERAIRKLQGEATGEEPEATTGPETPAAGEGGDQASDSPAPGMPEQHVKQSADPSAVPCPPGVASLGGRHAIDIDMRLLNAGGYLIPGGPPTRMSEEYQQIKRRLLGHMVEGMQLNPRPANLIMVTSSLPGEGKTFTVANLAISLAQEVDRTVLVVDTDIVKSDLSRLLGVHEEPGLFDYLDHPDHDIGNYLLRTNLPNLTLLPAGRTHGGYTEKLASSAMARLADELASRYADRVILFDCPPVLASSGAAALAPCMGQVVMVVEAERTTQATIRQALHAMEHVAITGLVFNKSRRSTLGGSYGYGYGQYAQVGGNG